MASKIIDVALPEWVWLNGGEHERGGDPLAGRDVIYHVRSASVIEFFEDGCFVPNGNVLSHTFSYKSFDSEVEHYIAVLHYSAACDDGDVLHEILSAAAKWYCDYLSWEDNNIINEDLAGYN